MKQEKSYLGLELLRFTCAVAVVFWHYQHFFVVVGETAGPGFDRSIQPLHGLFGFFYTYGHMSVSVFWEISGFIFFWKYHDAVRDGLVSARSFFVLRFSRLYPLHFATLLLMAALQFVYMADHQGAPFIYGHEDLKHFLLGLGFASGWGFEDGLSFNGPIWSVSAEIVVYALFFVLSTMIRGTLPARLAILAGTLAVWFINNRLIGSTGVQVLLSCAVYFFTGGVVHAITRLMSPQWLRRAAPVALVVAVAIVAIGFKPELRLQPPVFAIAFTTSILFGFLGLDLWSWTVRPLRLVAPLADTTYSSYLVHSAVQTTMVIVSDRLGWDRRIYESPVALVLFLGLVFGIGWVVFHHYERPAQAWLRRAMLGRRAPPGAGETLSPA